MPNVSVTLPDTSETISRPVVFDLIDQVSKITKINKDTKVFFAGDTGTMQTNGSSLDSTNERYALFKTNYINYIEVEEEYDDKDLSTTAAKIVEQRPIFLDSDLGVRVTPIYVSTNLSIAFKYTCPNKTEALRWRDDMRLRVSQMRDINLHELTYQYLLPAEIRAILQTVYDRRENKAPYNESFYTYFKDHSDNDLTLVGDMVGNDMRLSKAETQVRVLGIYDFDALPEKPERDDDGVWTISFTYKVRYDKPVACNVRYPIMVHNQLMPENYVTFTTKTYNLDDVSKDYRRSLSALNYFESDTAINRVRDRNPYIRIPKFDDYNLKTSPSGTGTVWTALCEIDSLDLRSLLNLRELGDVTLAGRVLDFMTDTEWEYLNKPYLSIFNVAVYRNEFLLGQDALTIDQDLNVMLTEDADLRNQYRVRLSVVNDLTLLDPRAIDRLKLYPSVLLLVVQAINKSLRNTNSLDRLKSIRRVSEQDFSLLYMLLTGYGYGNGTATNVGADLNNLVMTSRLFRNIDPKLLEEIRQNKVQRNNVMQSVIIAHRIHEA